MRARATVCSHIVTILIFIASSGSNCAQWDPGTKDLCRSEVPPHSFLLFSSPFWLCHFAKKKKEKKKKSRSASVSSETDAGGSGSSSRNSDTVTPTTTKFLKSLGFPPAKKVLLSAKRSLMHSGLCRFLLVWLRVASFFKRKKWVKVTEVVLPPQGATQQNASQEWGESACKHQQGGEESWLGAASLSLLCRNQVCLSPDSFKLELFKRGRWRQVQMCRCSLLHQLCACLSLLPWK